MFIKLFSSSLRFDLLLTYFTTRFLDPLKKKFLNPPAQAKSLLLSLEQATIGIRFHVNLKSTKFLYFYQDGTISSLDGKPQKEVDQFTYQGSNISSTENYVNVRIGKAWTPIDKLSICTIIWIYQPNFIEILREKTRVELHKNSTCSFKQILEAETDKTTSVRPLISHSAKLPSKMSKTQLKKY